MKGATERVARCLVIAITMLSCAWACSAIYHRVYLAPRNDPDKGEQTRARGMVDTLALGILIYAESNNGALPPKETWRADIAPILVGSESMFSRKLASRRDDGGVPEFVYVPPAPRTGETVSKLSDIVSPSTYILVYEDYTRVPASRPEIVAGLADDTTELLERGELRVRLAKQATEQAKAAAAIAKSKTEGHDDDEATGGGE